ncbi:polysaccharide deacetylase [Spartobacteria bacterium LR76]|nr:polysaccharide deacetylase [Spartobacteria bacterium LR76]
MFPTRLPPPAIALMLGMFTFIAWRQAPAQPLDGGRPLLVVIKADDLTDEKRGIHPGWQRFVDFIVSRQMKAGIGIISRSLEGDKPAYFDWIRKLHASGSFEFWNHGYDHKRWTDNTGTPKWEFAGTSEDEQKLHLEKSAALARDKLGITFRTFGAPFNQTDDATARLLAADPDCKVWLYGEPGKTPPAIFIALRPKGIVLEPTALKPDFAAFEKSFRKISPAPPPYLVLQGHPSFWGDSEFAEFVRIIDFLTAQGAEFITPEELAARSSQARSSP